MSSWLVYKQMENLEIRSWHHAAAGVAAGAGDSIAAAVGGREDSS